MAPRSKNLFTTMDYGPLIEKKRQLIPELEAAMSEDGFFNDLKRSSEITREYKRTKKLLEQWDELESCRTNLKENEELTKGEDEELAEMAREEIPGFCRPRSKNSRTGFSMPCSLTMPTRIAMP